MDEKEYRNVYVIPANYTDSGKLFGGMPETRNTVKAGILVLLAGYPELLPLGIVALMGIGGDSLFQYLTHILRFWRRRRKLHFRRLGYRNEREETPVRTIAHANKSHMLIMLIMVFCPPHCACRLRS